MRSRYGEKDNLPTWRAGYKEQIWWECQPSYLPSRLWGADMVRRSTFIPGEQVMRSRYGEKVNLPTWRAGDEEQIGWEGQPAYLASRLWGADMVRRSTFLPGEQVMRSRYGERVNFPTRRAGNEEQIWWKGHLPTWRAGFEEQIWWESQPSYLASRPWDADMMGI